MTELAVLHPAMQPASEERAVVTLLARLRGGSSTERVVRILSETVTLRSLVLGPGEAAGCLRLSAQVECAPGETARLLGALGFVPGLNGLEWRAGDDARRDREYALLEVAASGEARARVIEVASVFRGRVVDACAGSLTLELSGIPDELDAARDLLGEFGITRMLRTGPLTLGSPA